MRYSCRICRAVGSSECLRAVLVITHNDEVQERSEQLMRLIARGLGCTFTVILAGALLALAAAFLWTGYQIVAVNSRDGALASTTEARRAAYRATATAINVDHDRTSLQAGNSIVLLQQKTENTTPEPSASEATAKAHLPVHTPAPEDISLPKLLVPRDPAEGKWLMGTKVPSRAPETPSRAQTHQCHLAGQ